MATFVTVIDDVVAPLLHANDPVKFPAVKTELPQLLCTAIVGVAGIGFTVMVTGADIAEHPSSFV